MVNLTNIFKLKKKMFLLYNRSNNAILRKNNTCVCLYVFYTQFPFEPTKFLQTIPVSTHLTVYCTHIHTYTKSKSPACRVSIMRTFVCLYSLHDKKGLKALLENPSKRGPYMQCNWSI